MRQTNLDEFMELEEHNRELEKKIHEEVLKNRQKDELIFQQSKLASMGEMLGNIAHQWRQPLMEINSLFIPIEAKLNLGQDVSKEELLETIAKLSDVTNYMSNTINDFREFFAKDKEKVTFKLSEQINQSYSILSATLKETDINLEIVLKKNPVVFGYKNEYLQVLINILNNAKDVLIQRKVKEPLIRIIIDQIENNAIILIEDNAGGIKVEPIEDIFKPFFTYDKTNGSGIGLFMSKLIIENNMQGKLEAKNSQNGASFTLSIPTNL